MAQPSVNRREKKAKGIPDTWECRYFVHDSNPPHGFEHDHLRKEKDIFDKWDGPHNENDVYFIAADTNVNVKLRKQEKTKPRIKLRVRLRHEPDGFELWRTEINDELSAPAEVWREVLARLKVKGNIERLSSCSEPDQVKKVLRTARPRLLRIETWKQRWRYFKPQGDMEVARVTIGSSVYYSVSFESNAPDPSGIRAIRDKLRTDELKDELGTPENYVELLSKMFLK